MGIIIDISRSNLLSSFWKRALSHSVWCECETCIEDIFDAFWPGLQEGEMEFTIKDHGTVGVGERKIFLRVMRRFKELGLYNTIDQLGKKKYLIKFNENF